MGRQTLTHIISIMAPQRYSSDSSDATALGKPLKFEFSGREAKNRFLKAAMTERISSWDPKDFKARGIPSEPHQRLQAMGRRRLRKYPNWKYHDRVRPARSYGQPNYSSRCRILRSSIRSIQGIGHCVESSWIFDRWAS